jgi:hypothetical protein
MSTWEYRVESIPIAERRLAKKQRADIAELHTRLSEFGGEGSETILYEATSMVGSVSTNLKRYVCVVLFKRQTA